ncbi:methyl-accepting chemotaxis protein [Indioceanicola profundi]|uniref:methyl-accepting chemotaxis protein n=1 Tax=Indioceanicola profundi TaxID=2220096 RepID=UPI0013C3EAC1|nr:methyl-accepting chemotaxis protein [Indioceanicola profundi]
MVRATIQTLMSRGRTQDSQRGAGAVLDRLPIAVMTCDIRTFRIDYANAESRRLLQSIRHVLRIDPAQIVGTSVDIFHKHPEHQRRLMSDPKNLPHKARITVGEEVLDLHIDAVHDIRGTYTHAALTWSVVTERVRVEKESRRLLQMIDRMPINVMTCDPDDDFRINYLNQTSRETLKRIEAHLPTPADRMLGQTIDVFHKQPTHQRKLLADPRNLPHQANIRVGPEVLNLRVSAITDGTGAYLGPMLTWAIISDQVKMEESVSEVVRSVSASAAQMDGSARHLLELAGNGVGLAGSVAEAAEQMSAAIGAITDRIAEASRIAGSAAEEAERTDGLVSGLAEVAAEVSKITDVIGAIAAQTNLLALNATIEAARAGEAGKGFAVVAGEVKSLANQTSRATEDIKRQIERMQEATGATVAAIGRIGSTIQALNAIAAQVATAAEEQSVTTAEVSRNISGVSAASRETGNAAQTVGNAATQLNQASGRLSAEIDEFLKAARR